jgi:predicted extracellular nuclease
MRSVFSAALLLPMFSSPAYADLFFSEYVERSSNNKAVEIYNPGPGAVDLSTYAVVQYNNGSVAPTTTIKLEGNLAGGQVYVIVNAQSSEALKLRANLQSGSLNFNGDDVLLLKKSEVVIDRFGQLGFDPGTAWESGGLSTLDRTLRRKLSVTQGDTAFEAVFDPAVQWDGFDKDDFTGLGVYSGTVVTEPGTPAVVAVCGVPSKIIADVQGSGATSTLVGQRVHLEAIVTGNYLGANGFSGFFVQQADNERVRRANTSEGIFVYATTLDDATKAALKAGNRVHLVGEVQEAFGQTQIKLESNVAVCAPSGQATAEPLMLPLPQGASFAQYEGMLVTLAQQLVVNDVYELGRYGSVALGSSLLPVPTHVAEPGTAAQAQLTQNDRSRIILDDGLNNQNPATLPYPQGGLRANNTLRRGYTTSGVTGVLEMRYSKWRLQPVPGAAAPVFEARGNPRSAPPARSAGSDTRVGAFNVLNYFNGDGQGAGFDDPTNRGAPNQAEYLRQHAKIVAALNGMDADVIGLMEIENDGYGNRSAIQSLVTGLGSDWRFVNPGVDKLGTDAITVALIYRANRVKPVGTAATLAIDDKNRQPLAQTFEPVAGGKAVTVVVNHLKSKSCGEATGADADQNDGQSCWVPTRLRAAGLIADWLGKAPTGVADSATLIVGDLNSYAKEQPIARFQQAGFADLQFVANGAKAYTYVFNGEAGYLDHALGNPAAQALTRGVHDWNINADEPIALEYTTAFKSQEQIGSFYAPDAYRSSDHDPVMVDLALANTPTSPAPGEEGSSGGGSLGWLPIGLLAMLTARGWRRRAVA